MNSLQEISAEQLVNTYPIDVLELIVKKGQERLRNENAREVVITYKYQIDKTLLLDYLDFLIRMQLPYDEDVQWNWRDKLLPLLRKLNIKNKKRPLTELFKIIREKLINNEITPDTFYTLANDNDYGWSNQDQAFKKESSSKILKLLEKYGQYRKYFTIAKCHKNDYVVIYFNEGDYGRHLIGSNLDHMNIETGGGQFVYTVYQVD